ncbi:cory-CC-star protein [Cytobacillus sp. IB215665]|uniref:cory-CC-star protein n=1 Tax=Cytobacillus sp. IB215665 TaxID=3097357 RepID=UPI002A0D7170|nr:cory-CC-star protein [Cytobacillus sp. IB215665]MDX8366938.1 cory-CC-star protein [Cytobacillus sp. IB215665]
MDKAWNMLKILIKNYDEMLKLPHRIEIARELRDEDDLFILLCSSELLGVPNPIIYYTLELYPYLIENFHEWHLRMGMEHSPLDGIRCC